MSRLLEHLAELASIGERPDGGVCRLAFTDLDLAGRSMVAGQLQNAGLEIRVDAIGNLFGILRGSTSLPAVMVGSHTDTVGTGGRFDGALGVVAAVECVTKMQESGRIPERTIVVASFVNEEGVRFMPDMMGSLYHSHQITLRDAMAALDSAGTSIGQELDRQVGFAGTDTLDDLEIGFFLELHIEQGPILESENRQIGVVAGVQGLSWTEVEVLGSSNHAGTTPMDRRRDAGLVSGDLMSALRQLPAEIENLRLTIGSVTYHPNLVNVIANRVTFTVDMRHPDPDRLLTAEARMTEILNYPTVCDVSHKRLARTQPCHFSDTVISAVQSASDELGYSSIKMISGAGHDAQILQSIYQSGMIFIPSRGGISHSAEEFSTPEQVEAGTRVLFGALQRLAGA
ncbi:MAG: M20 family metallo-hydrolase [Bacteroidetes bacterium]|nr:M20 family metallo-hydrolase [Bacteroidota bacterium]